MERVGKLESFQEIIAEMTESGDQRENQPRLSITDGKRRRMTDNSGSVGFHFDGVCPRQSQGGPTVSSLCHADRMTKKQTKRTMLRSTDWNVGHPLAFPQLHAGIKSAARAAVDEAMSGLCSSRRQKHKKK
jgi:hypothetical protein